ncbi:MAG: hypothetical protein ACRENI_14500 [Gemmatimonadaceae bacterium]
MTRKLWLASMSLVVLTAASAPSQAQEAPLLCLMDGSTCYSAAECCSNRCNVEEDSGTCIA